MASWFVPGLGRDCVWSVSSAVDEVVSEAGDICSLHTYIHSNLVDLRRFATRLSNCKAYLSPCASHAHLPASCLWSKQSIGILENRVSQDHTSVRHPKLCTLSMSLASNVLSHSRSSQPCRIGTTACCPLEGPPEDNIALL